jgi:hypothetical protein
MGDIPGGRMISQIGAPSGSIDRLRYRTDNPMQPHGARRSRALLLPIICRTHVIDDKTSESDLDLMGKAGIRGVRLNLVILADNPARLYGF